MGSGAEAPQTASRDGEELQEKIQASKAQTRSARSVLLETGLVNGASAGLSGAIAAVITTPSDVVKTRMMLVNGKDGRDSGPSTGGGLPQPKRRKGPSVLEIAKRVVQERGIRGLFRGGALRAAWAFLGSGLYLGTYEVAKVWLKADKDVGKDRDL